MSTEVGLPGSMSETALELPENLSFEEWEQTGVLLGRIGRACQWWVGDWLNFGEKAYGEKYAQAMEATGHDYSAVANYAWVAKAVEPSTRVEGLSWSHHREVAKLTAAEQGENLEQAAQNGWTVSELKKQVRKALPPASSEPIALTARETKVQEGMIVAAAERAEYLGEDLIPGIKLDAVSQTLPEEKREGCLAHLREARTALSRLIGALEC